MRGYAISHRKSGADRWSWLAFAVALLAVAIASWLAVYGRREMPPAPPLAVETINEAPGMAVFPDETQVEVITITPPRTQRRRRAPTSVPLDASVAAPGEDFEVLSASELEGISQARE